MLTKWQKLRSLNRRIIARFRNHGPINTCRIGLLRVHEMLMDWRLGIETRGRLQFLAPEREDVCVGYEASDYTLISRSLNEVKSGRGDVVFLDYGCGKGRTAVLAAMQPFHRVIGIDLDQSLLDIAQSNIDRARRRLKCDDVSLIHADATAFEVPDDVNVIFMFNPFIGDVMKQVIDRIQESLSRADRYLTLIFLYPPNHVPNPFEEVQWLVQAKELPVGSHRSLRLLIYESTQREPLDAVSTGREPIAVQ